MKTVHLPSLFAGLDYHEKFTLYRELWQKTGNYEILTNFPLHLDIELSGVCNLQCTFCFQNGLIEQPLDLMDVELFKKVIDEGTTKGLCAIKLQIRGESFLHPQLFECITYAKDRGVMDVQVTTNGTLLDQDKIQQVFTSGLDAIIFSVDAHHENSFAKAHRLQSYSSVEQAIQDLLALREKLGKSKPWVRLQASIPQSDTDSFQRTELYLKEKFPKADIMCVNRIHNFRDDVDSYPDLHENYDFHPCSYLMQRLAIFWNGDCTTCCMDYNNRFQLGNISSQTIENIWLSPKMRAFRELHLNNRRKEMPICKYCGACMSVKNEGNASNNIGCNIDSEL